MAQDVARSARAIFATRVRLCPKCLDEYVSDSEWDALLRGCCPDCWALIELSRSRTSPAEQERAQ